MCGICGVIQATGDPVSPEQVVAMRDTMTHRGPDGAGLWLSEDRRVALGHRRLSIIDLSDAAAQPMLNEDGAVVLSFNGEIYNHRELRVELEAAGHRFRSGSDAEVVVHGYEQWGEEVLDRLDGMFAFGLWDQARRRLFCARDRMGIKPFYYTCRGGRFLFASEIKALLAYPGVVAEVDATSLYQYFTFIAVPPPRTMFEGISKLPAGAKLSLEMGGTPRIEPWWSPARALRREEIHTRPEAAIEYIRTTLRSSIKKRMMSDVPFGVFLSGGVDSSLNVALMSEVAGERIRTYSVAPKDEPELDELSYARRVAQRFGTDHHEVRIDERDMLTYLPEMIYQQDEPIGDCVCVPLHYVAKLLKDDGATVVQVGEGSDEQFAGYWWFQNHVNFERRFLGGPLRRLARKVLSFGALRLSDRLELDPIEVVMMRRLQARQEVFWGGAIAFQHRDLAAIAGSAYASGAACGERADQVVARGMADLHSARPRAGMTELMEFWELRQRLPELLLMRVDKMTMGNSVEARVPFLDTALVDYTMNLSPDLKIRDGEGKWILKRAAEGLLPDDIVWRRKQGFGAPTTRWFRGELANVMERELDGNGLVERGFVNAGRARQLLAAHREGRAEHSFHLWVLLNALLWYRRFCGA